MGRDTTPALATLTTSAHVAPRRKAMLPCSRDVCDRKIPRVDLRARRTSRRCGERRPPDDRAAQEQRAGVVTEVAKRHRITFEPRR